MRVWGLDVRTLCDKHLLGEHGESHKFLPAFRRGVRVHGRFYPVVQIQFRGYKKRHDLIAEEMVRRGMNHRSPLTDVPDFKKIYPEYYNLRVDEEYNRKDLHARCKACKRKYYGGSK